MSFADNCVEAEFGSAVALGLAFACALYVLVFYVSEVLCFILVVACVFLIYACCVCLCVVVVCFLYTFVFITLCYLCVSVSASFP